MPSGSHGGGGGFGGHGGFTSSSFGSSRNSSFRSSRSSGGHRPRGPRYFRFGHRTLIITTGRQNLISVCLFFIIAAMLLLFTFGSSISACKEERAMIEEEYAYYQNMIEYAELNENQGYIIKAKVTEKQYDSELKKYRYIYSFKTSSGGTENGYTFYIYSLEELPAIGTEFDLAVDSVPVTSNTDSIPVDYKFTTLEDDSAYVVLNNMIKKNTLIVVGIVAVIVLGIGGIVAIILTAKRKEEEKKEEEKQKEIEEEKKKFCQYCGTKIKETDSTCPNCGSRLN